jgi:hypothetical protein
MRHYFRRAIAATTAALLIAATCASAQDQQDILKITRPQNTEKKVEGTNLSVQTDKAAAFQRLDPSARPSQKRALSRRGAKMNRQAALERWRAHVALAPQSFGTGGGDIFENEPNDPVAQGVSLPVNVFGEIRFDNDVDYFAFESLAGQQVTVEAFAARFAGSLLIADIALFDADGDLITSSVGDEDDDPIIRYTSTVDEVLIVGIRDADDQGGSRMDYLLNVTRGVDVEEDEPNGTVAQVLPALAATVFGQIDGRTDVDFYSFLGTAGQTLILDLDAEVLGSRLDAEMNLSDPSTGVEFFYSDQVEGDDPRFNIVLPYTGRYVIGVGSFNSNSEGFYRLNASLVSSNGAPIINSVTKLEKKLIEVAGTGFNSSSVIEVNGKRIRTTFVSSFLLRGKVKIKPNKVVTVTNDPDRRRSNPLVY